MLKGHCPQVVGYKCLSLEERRGLGEIKESQLGLSQEWMWSSRKYVPSNDRRGLRPELWGPSPVTAEEPLGCVSPWKLNTR